MRYMMMHKNDAQSEAGVLPSMELIEKMGAFVGEHAKAGRLIDGAGLRGLAQRFASARREGHSITDVIREAVTEESWPEWLPAAAVPVLRKRFEARRRFCQELLEEL